MKKLIVVREKKSKKGRVYTPADLMSDPLSDNGIQSHWWYYENEGVINVNQQRKQSEKRCFTILSELEAGEGWATEGEP